MAYADVDMDIHNYENSHETGQREPPIIQQHQASEMKKKELLYILQNALGILQMIIGILSIGMGIALALIIDIGQSFTTLFRLFQVTGVLSYFAGLTCHLLSTYPALLAISLYINYSSIAAAASAAWLISIDLMNWNQENNEFLKLSEILEVCLLGLEIFLSSVLCIRFSKDKRATSK